MCDRSAVLTSDNHDRIELKAHIATTVDDAWALISEPGWFINSGQLGHHDIKWEDQRTAIVTDADHGTFTFKVEALEPLRHVAYRGLETDGQGGSRLVEFWVVPQESDVVVQLVESGFASMAVPVTEQVAQFEQNTKTWQQQLMAAKESLQTSGPAAPSR